MREERELFGISPEARVGTFILSKPSLVEPVALARYQRQAPRRLSGGYAMLDQPAARHSAKAASTWSIIPRPGWSE